MTRWFTILAALVSSGCTTMQTRPAGDAGQAREGVGYYLPEAVFRLSVTQTGGALTVEVGGSQNLPDRTAALEARLPRNGISDDNVTITLSKEQPLLSRVEVTSTGRVTQIAGAAARSFGMTQGSDTNAASEQIFDGQFTFNDYELVVREANGRLRAYYENKCPGGQRVNSGPFSVELEQAGYTAALEQPVLRERLLLCRSLALAGVSAAPDNEIIKVSLDEPTQAALAAPAATDFAQCARGVCHRPLMPATLTLSVGPYYSRTSTFSVPDRSRLMFIGLPAGIFAQQRYTLTFTNGVLDSYNQNAQSELVGLFSLPGDIVAGVLKAQAEALGLRQTTLTAETNYLAAVRANVDARQQTEEVCSANATACPGTAYRVMRVTVPRQNPPASSGASTPANAGGNSDKGRVPGGGG